MMLRLAWKEYREGRTIWLAMALLGVGAVYLLPVFLDFLGEVDPGRQRTGIVIALLVLSATYGMVAGSMLLAGEREGQTLAFLDVLTGSREQLWRSKLLVGAMFALAQGLVLATVFHLGALEGMPGRREVDLLWVLPALTLEALAWGLLSSAFSRTVLAGAGSGAALCALSWLLVAAYATFSRRRGLSFYLSARLLVDALALLGSYAAFCRRPSQNDQCRMTNDERMSNDESLMTKEETSARAGFFIGASSFFRHSSFVIRHSLWWLVWRQGRGEVIVVGMCLFVLGIGFASHVSMLWPLATLLTGIVFGTSVWAREQADASYRFLTNQRLPPGRVWLVKTTFAAGAALACIALGLLGAGIHLWLAQLRQPEAFGTLLGTLRMDVILFRGNSAAVGLIWLAHGFAAGQLLGMVCRKNLVAVMMSLPVSLMLVGIWLPSLIDGGLPPWQVYIVPGLVLAACRFLLWPWATDNLVSRRSFTTLMACAGAGLVVVACCLAYRVLGVPDAGPPFDVEAFTEKARDRNRLEAGQRLRQALAELASRRDSFRDERPRSMRATRIRGASETLQERILRLGWEAAVEPGADNQNLNKDLDDLFADKWFKDLTAALESPSAVLFDPRQSPSRPALAEVCDSRAPRFLALRSLQLLARGERAVSLRHLVVLLRLSRVLRNAALPAVYQAGQTAQELALRALEHWMMKQTAQPALLRQALAELDRHEAELPPPSESLRADYLGATRRLSESYQDIAGGGILGESSLWYGQLFALAQLTPWEQARSERLINLAYTRAFAGEAPSRVRLGVWQGAMVSSFWPGVQADAEKGLWRLRLDRLRLALLLFQAKKGRAAESLAELVPEYLRAVPEDPFTGVAFVYRIEDGKAWLSSPIPPLRRRGNPAGWRDYSVPRLSERLRNDQ